MMKHNSLIPAAIRDENDSYTASWISSQGLKSGQSDAADVAQLPEPARVDSSPFEIVWLQSIDRLWRLIPDDIDLTNYTLLDVGCGSGISTLYFFSCYQISAYLGFDFDERLIRTANENKRRLAAQYRETNAVHFYVENATDYQVPRDPLLLFMFNPFGWDTMKKFIDKNLESLRETKSLVLYANDVLIESLSAYCCVLSRDEFFNLSVSQFR